MSEHSNYHPHRNKQHNIQHKQNTLNKKQNHQQYNNIKNASSENNVYSTKLNKFKPNITYYDVHIVIPTSFCYAMHCF